MSTTSEPCQRAVNIGWTCIQHKIVGQADKKRIAWLGAIGGVIYQALISGVFLPHNLSSLFRSENLVGTSAFLVLIAIMVWVGVKLVVAMDETSLVKYATIAAAAPFLIFNGVFEPIIRLATSA